MKVFQINSVCGIRSMGQIYTYLADVLAENGYECRIAYEQVYNSAFVAGRLNRYVCTE
jgi:glycosyltransferase